MPSCQVNFLLFLGLIICMYKAARIPLIIDTDIGTNFDDAMAVTYSLSRQDIFDIQLILTSSFNTTSRARLTAKMLTYMNNSHIDIGIGMETPCYSAWYNCTWIDSTAMGGIGPQYPWAANYSLSTYGPGVIYSNGIQRAIEILTNASPGNPVWLLAIAPFVSLGDIFLMNPLLKANTRLFTTANYYGYDYNTDINISLSQVVFNYTNTNNDYGMPYQSDICSASGEITWYFQIYGQNYQNLLKSINNSILANIIIQNYNVWYENGGNPNHTEVFHSYRPYSPTTATSPMYDVETVYMLECAMIDSCSNIQWLNMQQMKVAPNDSGIWNSLPENSPLQSIWETVSWADGKQNGTYLLGQHIVQSIIKY